MRGLYAIVDVSSLDRLGLDVVAAASAMLDGRPACLQLRAKGVGARRTLELLRALRPLAQAAGVPLFANDRPDLALLGEVDGVHVGQDDLAPDDVRALVGPRRLLLGLSTHDRAQVREALEAPIDYLAIGPVFGTSSKERPDPTLGVEGLRELVALVRSRRPTLPIVAIGGIDRARLADVAPLVDMVAVIAALLPSEPFDRADGIASVRSQARELTRALERGEGS